MNNSEDTPNQSGPKDGYSENHWREQERPSTSTNENPLEIIEKDLGGIRGVGNASTKTKEEAVQSIEEKIKAIRESREGKLDKLIQEESPAQKYTEKHPSKKGLSNPEKINEPTETKTPEPIEPASSNTEPSNIDDQGNLNKLQEPQKAGEERPANSKLQGFIEDARTFAKNYFVPSAKIGGMIVGGATTLFDPSDTVDEATEQQAIKDWVEKNNINTTSDELDKEDNSSTNVQVEEEKDANIINEEWQSQNQLQELSQAGYQQEEIDKANPIAQTFSEKEDARFALNDLSNQSSFDDNASNFDETSKEDFKTALNDVFSQTQGKDDFDQTDQTLQNPTENNNLQLALNDLSNQPTIDDNTSSFDEISKEDFKAALNDAYTSIQDEKGEVSEMSIDLNQEDFSVALADLSFDDRKIKDTPGIPDRDDSREDVLDAMNDFNSEVPADVDDEKAEYFDVDKGATEDFAQDEVSHGGDMDDISLGSDDGDSGGMDMDM